MNTVLVSLAGILPSARGSFDTTAGNRMRKPELCDRCGGTGALYTSRRTVRGTIRLRSDHSPDFIGRSILLAAVR